MQESAGSVSDPVYTHYDTSIVLRLQTLSVDSQRQHVDLEGPARALSNLHENRRRGFKLADSVSQAPCIV